MMKSDNCRCPHHVFSKLLVLLIWVSGVLFFWSSWGARTFWGFNASYWAWTVVVIFLLAKSIGGMCRCCCGDKHCDKCSVQPGKQM